MIKNGERTRQFVLVISALGRLKQEDCQFEVSLGYIVRLCRKEEGRKEGRQAGSTKKIIIGV
jgi:hypothetical protein